MVWWVDLRLQESVSVSVNGSNRFVIRDGDLRRRDTDQLSVFGVGLIDRKVAFTLAGLQEEPEVGECSVAGCRDATQPRSLQVWQKEVGDDQAYSQEWDGLN